MDVTVTVDHDLCQGHGQCQEVAPEVFELRDDGLAYVVGEVTPERADVVQDAVWRCPVDAISTTE